MANTGKDTASFFENGTSEQFEYCYKLYPQVLKIKAEKRNKKPQELIRLDDWYQNELPKVIKGRGKDAHLVYDELVQTMKWKQTRGKFYPQLNYLVKVNTPRAVMTETKKAFRKLPNLEQAITALSNLKGVGTTMASALLAAACPDSAPFMADECLMAIPEIEGIDYTTKEYLNFVQHIQSTVTRLNLQAGGGETPVWSPHRVELALWAHYVANDLCPELLDEMPSGKGGGGASKANGSTNDNALSAAGDDTNDGDDDSAGRIDGNNVATESENENTNPTPHDGDSNFISNDSTSQEPIIDENTTQTTATETTDEGDGDIADGTTPLASDSESNIEAPVKAMNSSNNTTSAVAAASKEANNTSSSAAATVVAAANGNGSILAASAAGLDGENSNSNCMRESEYEDDESSNSRALNDDVQTPLINHTTTEDNDSSTLSSAGGGAIAAATIVGQKRTLNCADEASLEGQSQPELKKIRSD